MQRVHLLISGLVQGVGFRHFVRSKARERGLTGWVRNIEWSGLPADNRSTSRASNEGKASGKIWRVEVVAEGEKEKLEEVIKLCQEGPMLSEVKDVSISWQEASGEFEVFEIR